MGRVLSYMMPFTAKSLDAVGCFDCKDENVHLSTARTSCFPLRGIIEAMFASTPISQENRRC